MDAETSTVIAEGLLAGRLEGFSFPELLVALCRSGGTGVLSIAHRGVKKNLYIDRGQVIFAASEDPDDRLGVQLLNAGAITLLQLETAVKAQTPGKRLGTLLVESDSITADQLADAVVEQIRRIVLDLFPVGLGEYRFIPGPLPTEEAITLEVPTNALVFDGIRHLDAVERVRRGVGGLASEWCLSEAFEEVLDELDLDEGESLVIERLGQGPATVDELCNEVLLSNFEICRLVWALKVLGAIEQPGLVPDLSSDQARRDAATEEGFLEFLLQLHRARETGVLYATLGRRERSFHLRDGECVFATSNDPEDGLVAFLLRRGVISLRDREETVHRLLSNKRVGTILLELGVLDDDDLHDMVRRQLVEVVYDTFRWVSGEFSFVCGPLPSVEPITLDQSVEALVVTGLRRVSSWSRIRQGCGGLQSILALTPGYLDVLDAMSAGAEEWEVVNALRTPRSPLEVCQLSQLGDFRVCQILWAMKVLGGVEVIQSERPQAWEAPAARLFGESLAEDDLELEPAESGHEAPSDEVASEVASDEPPAELAADEEAAEFATDQEAELAADEEAADVAAHDEPAEVVDEPPTEAPVHFEAQPVDEDGAAVAEEAVEPELPEADPEAAPQSEALAADAEAAVEDEVFEPDEEAEPGRRIELEVETPVEGAVGEEARAEPEADVPDTDDDEVAAAAEQGEQDEQDEQDGQDVEVMEESEPQPAPAEAEPEPAATVHAAPDEGPTTEMEEPVGSVADDADRRAASIWDLEVSSRTVRLSRDEVDAAVAGAPGPPTAIDGGASGEPPPPAGELPDAEAAAGAESEGEAEPPIEVELPPETPQAGGPRWVPPTDLDASIARFNAMQRVIFRTVRSEVGAGAANFIRSCCEHGPQSVTVGNAELHTDGSWDIDGLRQAVIEQRNEDPMFDYRRLITREIEILRVHIGEARAQELREQVERVEAEHDGADPAADG